MAYNFTITARDLNTKDAKYPDDAPFTSSGQVYDLLAVASGHSEYNDIEEMNLDYYSEAVDYARKEWDYEQGFIEALNAASGDYDKLADLTGYDAGDSRLSEWYKAAEASGLLFGAWYALNAPALFAGSLKEWTDDVKDATHDCLGDYSNEKVPRDLAKALQEAYDYASEQNFKEYVNGDYRDWCGVYDEASKYFFGHRDAFAADDEDRKKNVVRVTLDEDEGTRLAEEYDGIETGKPAGVKRVKEAVVDMIYRKAKYHHEKERAENEKRRAERDRERAYREERVKKEEEERRERLLKMTR